MAKAGKAKGAPAASRASPGKLGNTRVNKIRRITKELALLRGKLETSGRLSHSRALETALDYWKGI